jgi:maltose O-acetyltransferase
VISLNILTILLKIRRIYNNLLRSLKISYYRKSGVKIGKGCFIASSAYIDLHCPNLIEIGDHVKITRGTMILCYDASKEWISFYQYKKDSYGHVRIGTNVFVGAHSIVMPGVTIGDNVIIGANSIVVHDIPANSIAIGNPAKKIKELIIPLK